ncbi:MAG: hypothetical protein V4651_03780 [Bacteroidota bacterium]
MPEAKELFKSIVVTLLFLTIVLLGAYYHEPWRDEIQAWMIATDAGSIEQLFGNFRYEGHPMLWYVMLYYVGYITHDILAMQLLSVGIATLSVFFFCRFSPFSWLQKTLFSFGFYPLFQYCILSRSYGLILLFVVLYVCLISMNPKSIGSWIVLVLMANTSATGCVLSVSFALTLLMQEKMRGKIVKTIILENINGLLLLLGGLVFAAWQIYPEPDNTYSAKFSIAQFKMIFSQLHDSYFYIAYWPDMVKWSTIYMRDMHPLDLVISLVTFSLFAVLFSKRKNVLFFYTFSTLTMLLFLTISNMFSARFIGHFYLILIAAYWLMMKEEKIENKKWLNILLTLVLVCQVIAGCGLLYADHRAQFSNAKRAAQYIQEKQLNQYPVTGAIDYTLSPLSYWLEKPLYYAETQSYGKYIVWNSKRGRVLSPEILLHETDSLVSAYEKAVVVVSTEVAIRNELFKDFIKDTIETEQSQWVLLHTFEGALVLDENYYIYLASRKNKLR